MRTAWPATQWKACPEKRKAYYIFVTDKKSSTGQSGYMKLNGQFGFVFDQNAITIAHELAHGAFKLEHPFKKFKNKDVSEGTTQSLMDYPPVANFLFTDWKQINDPAFKLYAFQSQSDGEHNPLGHLGITPNGKIFDQFFLNKHPISITYLISKNYTINSIKYNDTIYEWNTSKDAFVNGKVTITTKKIKVAIDNKVNVYQSRNNDKCIYDYALIEWTTENEKASNTSELIENKLESSSFTGWLPSPYDVRDASCSNNFSQEILLKDRQPCSLENVTQGLAILETALTKTDGEKVAELVNQVCLSALRGLDHDKKEDLIKLIASQDRLIEASELAILRLMTAIDSKNYHKFFELLEEDNNQLLKHLIAEIDDVSVYFLSDKKNYTNFMGALVTMFNQNPESIANRWPSDDDNFASRVINLEPISYSSSSYSFLSQSFTFKENKGTYDANTGKVKLFDVYKTYEYKAISNVNSTGRTETVHDIDIGEVSPLTPLIIIPNKGKLPLIETALGENSLDGNAYIVPAVFLKYTNDKIRNDYIEKAVITTLDVATIAVSGGTALATKVHWVRRAWAIAEVTGAVSNITVNTVQVSPEAKKIVDNFNLAMGVIGLKNVAVGGYKFAIQLPETTKNLLKQSKSLRVLLTAKYIEWNSKVIHYKSPESYINSEVRKLIEEQESVLGLLSGKVLRKFNNADEIAQYLKTDKDGAYFWSGRMSNNQGVMNIALDIAQSKGGNTLEGMLAKYNIEMPIWDANKPASVKAWEDVSALYATQVSGEVNAVLGKNLRTRNIWETIELPRLQQNPNVTKISTIDPETMKVTIIWSKSVNWNSFSKIKMKITTIDSDGWLMGKYVNGELQVVGNTNIAQKWDYIVKTDGQILVGRKHSWLSQGNDVLAAGELKFNNGKLVEISNASGHYLPSIEEASNFLKIFRQADVKVDDVTLTILKSDGTIYKQVYPTAGDRFNYY